MPFLGGLFIFLPGALPRGLAKPRPSLAHYWRLPGRTRRRRGLHRPAIWLRQLRRPPHPSRGPPCFIYSTGPGRHAERRTWVLAPRLPAREARARGKGLGPCARPWKPRAWALGPRPSPSVPSRSGRRQSSRPPPLPPATLESWQWRRQQRDKRARASSSLWAATSRKRDAYSPSIRAGTKLSPVPFSRWRRFPPDSSGKHTTSLARTGKGRGDLFSWHTLEPRWVRLLGTRAQPSSDFLGSGPPCCWLCILSSSGPGFAVPF